MTIDPKALRELADRLDGRELYEEYHVVEACKALRACADLMERRDVTDEVVARFDEAYAEAWENAAGPPDDPSVYNGRADEIATKAGLLAVWPLDANARDAERYRWLRDLSVSADALCRFGASGDPELLDAAIDAAMSEQMEG